MTRPKSAVQKLITEWRDTMIPDLGARIATDECADDLDRLDREVLQPAREAIERFAGRVQERNPEWFRERDTDFAEADHALRAALAKLDGEAADAQG